MPVLICHIDSKFGIVNVQPVILISHKSPMQAVLRCIGFECIEFVFYLAVYIFVLSLAFATLGFDDPNGAVFFHYNIVSIEQPLLLYAVHIYDGEVLLTRVTVLIDPLNIITLLAILLEQHFTGAADEACGKAGRILVVGVSEVFYLALNAGVVFKEVLLRNMKYACFRMQSYTHLLRHLRRNITEFLFQLMLIVDDKGVEFSGFQRNQLLGRITALAEHALQNGFYLVLRHADG